MAYTKSQMLSIWRKRQGLPGPEAQCAVETVAAVAIDDIIEDHMRRWYLELLAQGDARYVEMQDIGSRLAFEIDEEGVVTTELPEGVCHLACVKLAGWKRAACIVDPSSPVAYWQSTPFCRAGAASPVGVLDGRMLTLYSLKPGATPQAVKALAAVDDGPQVYHVTERALASIPELEF